MELVVVEVIACFWDLIRFVSLLVLCFLCLYSFSPVFFLLFELLYCFLFTCNFFFLVADTHMHMNGL